MVTDNWLLLSDDILKNLEIRPRTPDPNTKYETIKQFDIRVQNVLLIIKLMGDTQNEVNHVRIVISTSAKSGTTTVPDIETALVLEDDRDSYGVHVRRIESTKPFMSPEDAYAWVETRIKDGRIDTYTTFTVPISDTKSIRLAYDPKDKKFTHETSIYD